MVANRVTLSPTTIGRYYLVENKFTRNLFIEFTAKDNVPPRTRIIKQLSSSRYFGTTVQAVAKDHHASYQREAGTSASKKKRTTSKSNSKSSGEVKKKPFFLSARKPERRMPSRRTCRNRNQRINASSAARQDTGKDCPNPKKSLQLRAQYQSLTMLKKKSSQNRLFRRVRG